MSHIISYNPKVSLRPDVYYKTASASYDRLLDNGPLTDAKIKKYQARGLLGGNGIVQPIKKRASKKKRLAKEAVLKMLKAYE